MNNTDYVWEFEGKILLITGGTGSFGNAVLRRFLNSGLKQIRIFSRDEKKQADMRNYYNNPRIKFYIGDVREPSSIQEAMWGVDYVFHAAALKHVPSCEFYPMEAVRTNVIGTDNTLQAALNAGVKTAVVLSTDKAAYPINAMGTSKAMMEKIMSAKSRVAADRSITFCGTRYGNVMASRGSVIPLFIEQIEKNKPLTITNPNMTRFMMTLDSAVDLVIFAFTHAKPGDLFIQKTPAACLKTLAEALKKLLKSNVEIKYIGTRHGEKEHETLMTREEAARAEELDNYYRVPCDSRDLNYNLYFTEGSKKITDTPDYTSTNTKILNQEELEQMLLTLPEVKEALQKRGL